MHWGAGGTSDTKSRESGGIFGVSDQDLGAMAGEISPDIMFWGVWQKMVWMVVDGCKSI